MSVQQKITHASDYLNDLMPEREDEIRMMLACVLAEEHMFMLGVPGVGKSMIVNELAKIINDATFFKKLMTAQTTNEEIFGPLDLAAFKANKLQFNTDGFAADTSLVFLDEIFKANSQTLNSLLTLMNERRFDNGNTPHQAPLVSLFGASNELPEDSSLQALKDRFAVKCIVHPVSARDNLFAIIAGNNGASVPKPTISIVEIGLAQKEAADLPVDDSLIDTLINIARELESQSVFCSVRKLKKVVSVLRSIAYMNGASKVSSDYVYYAANCFWNHPDEIPKVIQVLNGNLSQSMSRVNSLLTEAQILFAQIDELDATKTNDAAALQQELRDKLVLIKDRRDTSDTPEIYDDIIAKYEKQSRRLSAKFVAARRAQRNRSTRYP